MINPIVDNRIVNDVTFAVRLKSFLREVKTNDIMSAEEREYFCMIADKLLLWQLETVRE